MKINHSENFFNVHVQNIKIEIHPKNNYDMDL